jgi:hypothetical protein
MKADLHGGDVLPTLWRAFVLRDERMISRPTPLGFFE